MSCGLRGVRQGVHLLRGPLSSESILLCESTHYCIFYTIEKEFCCRKKKDYALYPHNPLAHLKFQLDKVRLENFKNSLSIVLCMDV